MAVDTNVSATNTWSLLKTGPTTEQGTVDYKGIPYEITTHATTPPETKQGRRVGPGGRGYTLKAGENLYGRIFRGLPLEDTTQVILS